MVGIPVEFYKYSSGVLENLLLVLFIFLSFYFDLKSEFDKVTRTKLIYAWEAAVENTFRFQKQSKIQLPSIKWHIR